jgi:hypothetical protein
MIEYTGEEPTKKMRVVDAGMPERVDRLEDQMETVMLAVALLAVAVFLLARELMPAKGE